MVVSIASSWLWVGAASGATQAAAAALVQSGVVAIGQDPSVPGPSEVFPMELAPNIVGRGELLADKFGCKKY